ncbi:DUF1963 domain-containing protein [Streptomyces sp. NPDC094438]|uniref:DUF1963 domain-containing protein n=1 Tax=Streptomyces sp. NPDC094438 TaxID=3366061 RepID=UPI003803D162
MTAPALLHVGRTCHLAPTCRGDTLFSDDAVHVIHNTGRGLPRGVNNMAMQTLIAAFTEKESLVYESSPMAIAEFLADAPATHVLQLAEDAELGWGWGDAGTMYFTIPEKAFAAGGFNKAEANGHCC